MAVLQCCSSNLCKNNARKSPRISPFFCQGSRPPHDAPFPVHALYGEKGPLSLPGAVRAACAPHFSLSCKFISWNMHKKGAASSPQSAKMTIFYGAFQRCGVNISIQKKLFYSRNAYSDARRRVLNSRLRRQAFKIRFFHKARLNRCVPCLLYTSTSAPASFAPCATASAMACVFPVPDQ